MPSEYYTSLRCWNWRRALSNATAYDKRGLGSLKLIMDKMQTAYDAGTMGHKDWIKVDYVANFGKYKDSNDRVWQFSVVIDDSLDNYAEDHA